MERSPPKVVLFDFDGTLFQLGADWDALRARLRRIAAEAAIEPKETTIFGLATQLDESERTAGRAYEAITTEELAGLERGHDLETGQRLYRLHAENGAVLAVVTHNSREVVDAFFRSRALPAPAEIFDRRVLRVPKGDAADAVRPFLAQVPADTVVVVGDSEHDRRLAETLEATYVDIADPLLAYYDRRAGELDELAATYESDIPYKRWFYRRRFETVMRALDAKPGDEVLEVGAGSGFYTRALVELGANVTATDLAPAFVEQARALAPAARFAVEDVQSLSFPDQSFDRVLLTEVIEHVPDPSRAVAEAARVLRPSGILAVSTPSRRAPMNLAYALKRRLRRYRFNEHLHELTPKEFRALLEPSFEIESFERVNAVLPYPLDSVYIRLGSPGLRHLDRIERALDRVAWTMVVRARRR